MRAAIFDWWSTTRMQFAKRWPSRGSNRRPGPFLDFLDPWGNPRCYDNVQFTKAQNVLRGMGLIHLSKNETSIQELTEKGMAPNQKRTRVRTHKLNEKLG